MIVYCIFILGLQDATAVEIWLPKKFSALYFRDTVHSRTGDTEQIILNLAVRLIQILNWNDIIIIIFKFCWSNHINTEIYKYIHCIKKSKDKIECETRGLSDTDIDIGESVHPISQQQWNLIKTWCLWDIFFLCEGSTFFVFLEIQEVPLLRTNTS